MSAAVSAAGRLFYIIEEGPIASVKEPSQWKLVARDAFSGVLLWKKDVLPWEDRFRPFRSGPAELARRLVAVVTSRPATANRSSRSTPPPAMWCTPTPAPRTRTRLSATPAGSTWSSASRCPKIPAPPARSSGPRTSASVYCGLRCRAPNLKTFFGQKSPRPPRAGRAMATQCQVSFV